MKIPDFWWIAKNRVNPRRRIQWLKGSVRKDGWKWNVRGVDDSYLSYYGHEDNLTREILRFNQPRGELFVDIGAHVGTWSIRASPHYQKVVSFEPTAKTAALLVKNIRDNHVGNVSVRVLALGAEDGAGTMHHFSHQSGGNSLTTSHPLLRPQMPRRMNPVQIRQLDRFQFHPTLVKVDTEGYELNVLAGASETLKHTGKIILEAHRIGDVDKISMILADAGFKVRISRFRDETHVIGERDN